jgi:para-aminobenzoate synthetase component I
MLNWANRFNIFLFLDSHSYADKYSKEEWMLAAGAIDLFSPSENILQQLKPFLESKNDWLFGHFSYDLKNHIEPLTSSHIDHIRFPEIFLFQPDIVIRKTNDGIEISTITKDCNQVFEEIISA